MVHRPFKKGRACACNKVETRHIAPPTANSWGYAYPQLKTNDDGRKLLCSACGHIDDELTHVPSLM